MTMKMIVTEVADVESPNQRWDDDCDNDDNKKDDCYYI